MKILKKVYEVLPRVDHIELNWQCLANLLVNLLQYAGERWLTRRRGLSNNSQSAAANG